jgi:hypothetical protein
MADVSIVTVVLVVAGVLAVASLIASWLIVLAGVVGPLTEAADGAMGVSPRPGR